MYVREVLPKHVNSVTGREHHMLTQPRDECASHSYGQAVECMSSFRSDFLHRATWCVLLEFSRPTLGYDMIVLCAFRTSQVVFVSHPTITWCMECIRITIMHLVNNRQFPWTLVMHFQGFDFLVRRARDLFELLGVGGPYGFWCRLLKTSMQRNSISKRVCDLPRSPPPTHMCKSS